jgi:hypothetical protein
MSKKSTGKRHRAIRPDAGLTTEQERAFAQWQRDFQKAYPLMLETQSVAKRLWQELLDAPGWRIAESEDPQHLRSEQPEMWTVGHAKVNYVDHIDVKGDTE